MSNNVKELIFVLLGLSVIPLFVFLIQNNYHRGLEKTGKCAIGTIIDKEERIQHYSNGLEETEIWAQYLFQPKDKKKVIRSIKQYDEDFEIYDKYLVIYDEKNPYNCILAKKIRIIDSTDLKKYTDYGGRLKPEYYGKSDY